MQKNNQQLMFAGIIIKKRSLYSNQRINKEQKRIYGN